MIVVVLLIVLVLVVVLVIVPHSRRAIKKNETSLKPDAEGLQYE